MKHNFETVVKHLVVYNTRKTGEYVTFGHGYVFEWQADVIGDKLQPVQSEWRDI